MQKDKKTKLNTSWGEVASWYDDLLEKGDGTYQKDLILPNLQRLMQIKKGQMVLDLACGQGFFSREFAKAGATVFGVDSAEELVKIAKENSPKEINYFVSEADNLGFIKSDSVDSIAIVLAIQNMEKAGDVFKECSRVLKKNGRMFLVMNHPAFRIPKYSSWQFDEEKKTQYRRIDEYLSESRSEIKMSPSDPKSPVTFSFHRPLQFYFKALGKNGFAVTRLEEWNGNKQSQEGPRKLAEDKARKEIPMFLMIESIK
ncbi:MAG: methyltransferase domain-containing protein [Candidatus Paceibacterota bacterium]